MLDIIVLAVLAVGVWQGWSSGFVKSLCSFAGFFVGLLFAYTFYSFVGEKLAPHLGESARFASVLAFILIWIVVPIALNFAGTVLTKFVEAICLGGANKFLGAVIGFVKYFLGTTLVLYLLVLIGIVSKETSEASFFGNMMTSFVDSFMASYAETTDAAAQNLPV